MIFPVKDAVLRNVTPEGDACLAWVVRAHRDLRKLTDIAFMLTRHRKRRPALLPTCLFFGDEINKLLVT